MSAPTYTLQQMFEDAARFQDAIGEIHARLRDSPDKDRLGDLLEQLQKVRAEAEEKVPAILKQKLEDARRAKVEMEDLARQLEESRKELDAREEKEAEKKKELAEAEAARKDSAAKPKDQPPVSKPEMQVPLPSLPEVPIVPTLGQDLRTELLTTYGGLTIR
jgi:hypothetical protein